MVKIHDDLRGSEILTLQARYPVQVERVYSDGWVSVRIGRKSFSLDVVIEGEGIGYEKGVDRTILSNLRRPQVGDVVRSLDFTPHDISEVLGKEGDSFRVRRDCDSEDESVVVNSYPEDDVKDRLGWIDSRFCRSGVGVNGLFGEFSSASSLISSLEKKIQESFERVNVEYEKIASPLQMALDAAHKYSEIQEYFTEHFEIQHAFDDIKKRFGKELWEAVDEVLFSGSSVSRCESFLRNALGVDSSKDFMTHFKAASVVRYYQAQFGNIEELEQQEEEEAFFYYVSGSEYITETSVTLSYTKLFRKSYSQGYDSGEFVEHSKLAKALSFIARVSSGKGNDRGCRALPFADRVYHVDGKDIFKKHEVDFPGIEAVRYYKGGEVVLYLENGLGEKIKAVFESRKSMGLSDDG